MRQIIFFHITSGYCYKIVLNVDWLNENLFSPGAENTPLIFGKKKKMKI